MNGFIIAINCLRVYVLRPKCVFLCVPPLLAVRLSVKRSRKPSQCPRTHTRAALVESGDRRLEHGVCVNHNRMTLWATHFRLANIRVGSGPAVVHVAIYNPIHSVAAYS